MRSTGDFLREEETSDGLVDGGAAESFASVETASIGTVEDEPSCDEDILASSSSSCLISFSNNSSHAWASVAMSFNSNVGRPSVNRYKEGSINGSISAAVGCHSIAVVVIAMFGSFFFL